MMLEDTTCDYTPHLIKVQQDLTFLHDLLKRNKHSEAATKATEIIVEARLLRNAIKTYVKQ